MSCDKTKDILKALKNEEIGFDYIEDLESEGEVTRDEVKFIADEYLKWSELESKIRNDEFDANLGKPVIDAIEKQSKVFTWGSSNADEILDPLQEHHHVIIAGNRGGGKTTWSFYLASENAKLGHKVLYISLEMKTSEIITSSCRKAAAITKRQWRDKTLITEHQKQKYYERKKELESMPTLEMLGASNPEDSNLEKILEVITAKNPDMVFVDNLDLVKTDYGNDNERQEKVSRAFMDYSNQNEIPIIMLHHINKSGEIRGNKKIEDNADLIFVCARNEDPNADKEQQSEFKAAISKSRDWGEYVTKLFYFNKGRFEDRYHDAAPGF